MKYKPDLFWFISLAQLLVLSAGCEACQTPTTPITPDAPDGPSPMTVAVSKGPTLDVEVTQSQTKVRLGFTTTANNQTDGSGQIRLVAAERISSTGRVGLLSCGQCGWLPIAGLPGGQLYQLGGGHGHESDAVFATLSLDGQELAIGDTSDGSRLEIQFWTVLYAPMDSSRVALMAVHHVHVVSVGPPLRYEHDAYVHALADHVVQAEFVGMAEAFTTCSTPPDGWAPGTWTTVLFDEDAKLQLQSGEPCVELERNHYFGGGALTMRYIAEDGSRLDFGSKRGPETWVCQQWLTDATSPAHGKLKCRGRAALHNPPELRTQGTSYGLGSWMEFHP